MSNNNEIEQQLANYPMLPEPFRDKNSTLIKGLLREVDESSFVLADWLDSLAVLYMWLNEKGLILPPEEGLSYIECAAKSVSSSAMLTHLPSLVDDFLEQYGCDRAVKKQH